MVGVAVNVLPLHIAAAMFEIVGAGLTVTITVNVAPGHVPTVGVTVYVAVCVVLVGFERVPLIFTNAFPDAPPVKPPVTTGAAQLYVVPVGTIPLAPFTGVEVNKLPLHIVFVILVTLGVGLTVTITVKVAPGQVPDVGVTVYVAV